MADVAEAAQEFAGLAKNLTAVGEVELRAELYKAIDEAARPAQEDVRKALPAFLPNRYARVLDDDLAFRTSKRTGLEPGVTIVATTRGKGGRRRIRRLNAGMLAHPLWGNRQHWYDQPVKEGFFDRPIEAIAPHVRDKILEAVRAAEEKALGR